MIWTGASCPRFRAALDGKYMTSEQSDFVNLSTTGDDPDSAVSMRKRSSDDSSFRKMTIADLDIDTIQWLSDDLQEGFALYDPDDRLIVANSEYIRNHAFAITQALSRVPCARPAGGFSRGTGA